jgi:two-component system sensor histidine kinase NreB
MFHAPSPSSSPVSPPPTGSTDSAGSLTTTSPFGVASAPRATSIEWPGVPSPTRAARPGNDGTPRMLLRAIEHTADAIFITDVKGVIEYVNPALEALTGFTRDELVGQTPRVFQSGHYDSVWYEQLWTMLLAGKVYHGTLVNRRRDGTIVHCQETIVPLIDDWGRISNFMAVGRDLTERVRVEEILRQLNQSLEQQAKRIARSLHDEAGQFLTAAYTAVAAAARHSLPAGAEHLRDVKHHLDQIEEQLRRLAHELRPRILDDLGLVPALEFLAEGVELRSGISVILETSVRQRLVPVVETTVYRVMHEALANVSRHSRAGRVVVRVEQRERALRCSVSDDGIGFDPSVIAGLGEERFGLIGMGDQLAALGGSLEIKTAPGCGTELIIAIPLED